MDVDFYFAKPYHSWERDANENMNGLIRQYFPKGYSFENITNEEVQRIIDILNNRPRKKLNFLTPNEFLLRNLSNQKVVPILYRDDLNSAIIIFLVITPSSEVICTKYSPLKK